MSSHLKEGQIIRARVLEQRGERVALGIYQGSWLRIEARSERELSVGSWIFGALYWDHEQEKWQFQLSSQGPVSPQVRTPLNESDQSQSDSHFDWSV